jgi:mono/diheme cytochrome c family protein
MLCLLVFFGGLGWWAWHQTDPYVQEVLHLSGNLNRGQAIFQANCAVCHGLVGNGNIGPSLQRVSQRKSSPRLIEQVISGKTPPMPRFQPNAQEMADLLRYLDSL